MHSKRSRICTLKVQLSNLIKGLLAREVTHRLELVKVVVELWDFLLESLSLSDGTENFGDLIWGGGQRVSEEHIPVVED